jgi:hypothetical protein
MPTRHELEPILMAGDVQRASILVTKFPLAGRINGRRRLKGQTGLEENFWGVLKIGRCSRNPLDVLVHKLNRYS